MARRGEGQFVAIEVNLRADPAKAGRLCRALGVSPNEAVGMIASWRELVLTKGTGGGVVKGYTAADIADFLHWKGKGHTPAKLLAALQAAGELGRRRSTFNHPYWADTPTGWYAAKRAKDRDRKVRGGSAEAPRNGDGDSSPIPSGSGQEVSKGPPGPPVPGGVGGQVDPRIGLTEWFLETYPRLKNQGVCTKLLARMSVEEAAAIRHCLPRQLPRYIAGMSGRNGRGVPFSDKYLREGYYLEFRPPKPKAPKGATNGHTRADLAEEKRLMVEREEAVWRKRDEIRKALKAEGATARGIELEQLVDLELEKQEQHQGGSPS